MRVKFTRHYAVRDGSGKEYREGDVEDFTPASALHFINRDAAVEIKEKTPRRKRASVRSVKKPAIETESRLSGETEKSGQSKTE